MGSSRDSTSLLWTIGMSISGQNVLTTFYIIHSVIYRFVVAQQAEFLSHNLWHNWQKLTLANLMLCPIFAGQGSSGSGSRFGEPDSHILSHVAVPDGSSSVYSSSWRDHTSSCAAIRWWRAPSKPRPHRSIRWVSFCSTKFVSIQSIIP